MTACPQEIWTDKYGGSGGGAFSTDNQGRINQISSWGYYIGNLDYLIIDSWSADEKSSTQTLGSGTSISTACTSFTLAASDYIIGYTIYSSDGIHGLDLHTFNGETYECVSSDYAEITYYPTCDGWPYYLIGWNGGSGSIIDRIQFQFALLPENATTNNTTPASS